MKYGSVPGVEKQVSRLVQGTVPISTKKLDESFALLDAVVAQGGNAFDTAHVYGGGDNERALGQWMKDRGNREQIVVLAKGCHHNQDRKRVTPFDIAADLHDSLARMQVEYVDLYVLHRDDPSVPVGPIVEALNHWKNEGLVRAFGGSNWSYDRIREANDYAVTHGLTKFAATSPNFSLANQIREPWAECITISGPQNEAARQCYRETQIAVFAWSSLAGGFFSGRITRENTQDWQDYFMKLAVDCYAVEENFQRLDRVKELAARKGATIPQIAMAWVMSQGLNLFALVGCNNGEEYAANAAALEIELTPEECGWLDLKSD
jgi:Predicted oxidoreductases (related to aryl-alcohol dehydrogenases)